MGTPEVAEVERWFLGRGLPHFIEDYSARRDVFTRALPLLTLILLVELVGALNFEWAWWVNVFVAAASFAGLLAVWAVTNRVRGRPAFARPESVGGPELAVFVLVPAVLPLVAGGQALTAANTFAGNCLLLGLIYLGTSYGVVPMTRWAWGRLNEQLGALVRLMVRALPLLLLFVVFLFLTPELWEVAASLNAPFLALAIGLFVVLGVVFIIVRTPDEVGQLGHFDDADECAQLVEATPAAALGPLEPDGAAAPPLTRRQWGNIGLVMLFSQGLQILFVSVMIGVFLVAFGLIVVTPETATVWVGRDVHLIVDRRLWGREVGLSAELLQVAAFLSAIAGFSFALSLLTDKAYRDEFLKDVVREVRQALAVRVLYLSARAAIGG